MQHARSLGQGTRESKAPGLIASPVPVSSRWEACVYVPRTYHTRMSLGVERASPLWAGAHMGIASHGPHAAIIRTAAAATAAAAAPAGSINHPAQQQRSSFSKWCQENRDVRCVLRLSTIGAGCRVQGAGCKPRLESGTTQFNPQFIYGLTPSVARALANGPTPVCYHTKPCNHTQPSRTRHNATNVHVPTHKPTSSPRTRLTA